MGIWVAGVLAVLLVAIAFIRSLRGYITLPLENGVPQEYYGLKVYGYRLLGYVALEGDTPIAAVYEVTTEIGRKFLLMDELGWHVKEPWDDVPPGDIQRNVPRGFPKDPWTRSAHG